jgi:hypothetical protein
VALVLRFTLHAQGTAGYSSDIEPRQVIDVPTAGILADRRVALDMDFYQSGGLLVGVTGGFFDRLLLTLSYGGMNLIGMESPSWNDLPGVGIKVRILDETMDWPALAIGFDSQGKEAYIDHLNRYTIKSPGLFLVASKNYSAAGFLSFHGGINYSFERSDNNRDPNIFGGVEKTLGPVVSVLGEYNLGLNDRHRGTLGRGRGYLNIGIHGSIGKGFTLGFHLKDLLQNQRHTGIGNRTLKLEYVTSF